MAERYTGDVMVSKLEDIKRRLRKVLEEPRYGHLKRDAQNRLVLTEENIDKMARKIHSRVQEAEKVRVQRARAEKLIPRLEKIAASKGKPAAPLPRTSEYKTTWSKGLRKQLEMPGDVAKRVAMKKEKTAAAAKGAARIMAGEPHAQVLHDIKTLPIGPYSAEQNAAFRLGHRQYLEFIKQNREHVHSSYGGVRSIPEQYGPPKPPLHPTRSAAEIEKVERIKIARRHQLSEIDKINALPRTEDKITMTPLRNKKTGMTEYHPTDKIGQVVSDNPGKYAAGKVRETVYKDIFPSTKGQAITGFEEQYTLGQLGSAELRQSYETGEMVSKEGQKLPFQIDAKSRIREKMHVHGPVREMYGAPGKPGQWSKVEYITLPVLKSEKGKAANKLGNFGEFFNGLTSIEKTAIGTAGEDLLGRVSQKDMQKFLSAKNYKKLTKRNALEFMCTLYADNPRAFAENNKLSWWAKFLGKSVQSGKWHLPKKVLVAAGAAGLLGAALFGPSEAEASTVETAAKGVAASTVRHALTPGYKKTDYSWVSDPNKRAEYEKMDDELAKIATSKRYKFGRDFFGSVFASWIGEKWAGEVMGQEFDPSIAGYIVGELPLWLIGGKIISSVIKGPTFAMKLARSISTGMLGRAIPETVQLIHGDQTLGEAALSTAEEGALWGAIDLVMKPLGGAAKYFMGVGKWRPEIPVTPEIIGNVEKSLMTRMMAFWPEKVGGPFWDGIVKTFKRIPGFEKMFIPPISRMDPGARRIFEERAAALNIKLDEAYGLAEKAYVGLKKNESHAALDLLRKVPLNDVALTHGITKGRLGQIMHNNVEPIRRAFTERGAEAVMQGLLRSETYIKNIETYVPRMFWPKELEQYVAELRFTPFKPMPHKVRLQLKRFMKSRKIPLDKLARMDPVNDMSYVTWHGLKGVIQDTELAKTFNRLSIDPENFAYASRKLKYGVQKSSKIPDTLLKNNPHLRGTQLHVRNEKWLKDNDWVKMPGSKPKGAGKKAPLYEFGALKGGWVRKEVAEQLTELGRVPGRYERLFSGIMSKWKYGKVILRPATHVRNLISNMILNDLGGLPFWKIHRYAEGARALKQRGNNRHYREAMEWGLLHAGFTRGELGAYYGTEGARMVNALSKGGGEKLFNTWHKLRGGLKKVSRGPSKLYDLEEKIFKMAKFIDNRKKGMAIEAAGRDAMKWTFNYGEITPFIRGVKTYAMPFVTFSYKALPIVAESVIKHPLRFAKWPLVAMGMTYAALDQMDIGKEDWNWLKRVLPEYMKTGHFMLIPFKDKQGRLQLNDLTYILPWGDVGELAQQGILRVMQNPAMQLTAQLSMNNNFFGQPIWHEWEDPKVKVYKALNHTWRTMMPAWTPDLALGQDPQYIGGYDWYNFLRMREGGPDAPTPGQFAASLAGIKLKGVTPGGLSVRAGKKKRWDISEARSYFRSLKRKHPNMIEKIAKAEQRALENIREERPQKRAWKIGQVFGNPLAWTPAPE